MIKLAPTFTMRKHNILIPTQLGQFFCIVFTMLLVASFSTKSYAVEITIDDELFELNRINEHVLIASQAFGTTRINFGIVIGTNEVVLISSMMRRNVQSIEELVRHVSGKPISKILVIDSDPFHHNGSGYFKDKGATVIGHENLLSENVAIDIGFSSDIVIDVGTEKIRMTHSKAHSQGYAYITLENSNVIFTGDALRNDWLIYAGKNGWETHINELRSIRKQHTSETLYVPGNRGKQASSSAQDVDRLINIYEQFRLLVVKLANEGLSSEAIAREDKITHLLKLLERYEEFEPYIIHHVDEVLEFSH